MKIKKLFLIVRGFFPEFLPVGVEAFKKYCDEIIMAYGCPDNNSIRFTIATMIPHLKETRAAPPRFLIYLKLHKAMANQIAGAMMVEIKERDQAERAARAAEEAAKVPNEQEKA